MDFLELTKKRYSVRSYTSQEVEKEKLDYRFVFIKYAVFDFFTESSAYNPMNRGLFPFHFFHQLHHRVYVYRTGREYDGVFFMYYQIPNQL